MFPLTIRCASWYKLPFYYPSGLRQCKGKCWYKHNYRNKSYKKESPHGGIIACTVRLIFSYPPPAQWSYVNQSLNNGDGPSFCSGYV